jgi:hypothetical protein
MKFATKLRFFGAAAVASLLLAPAAHADSGFYIGGALGQVNISEDFSVDKFDESDSAWKVMGGYIFDLPVIDFGVELAYNDFGAPSGDVQGIDYEIDVSGLTAYGMAGIDFGFFGFFAKAGLVNWDADLSLDGMDAGSDDGSDPAYGLGMRLTFSSLEVRAEYELLDVSDADDVDMLSLGVLWRF